MKTYIVIPVYNEERHIGEVLRNIKKEGYTNIIVVNDGSEDYTSEIAKKEKGILVIDHSINCGPGAAIQTGIKKALSLHADIIVAYDGDGQHDPKDLKRVLAPVESKKADVSLGSRFLKKNKIPYLRRGFNYLGNIITFIISGLWVSDSQSGFKAFSRSAAQKISIETSGYEFCSEIIWKIAENKLSYKEVPIHVYYTKDSLAKGQSFANGEKTFFKLIIRSLLG